MAVGQWSAPAFQLNDYSPRTCANESKAFIPLKKKKRKTNNWDNYNCIYSIYFVILRSRPHASVYFFKTEIFLSGLAYRPHVSSENDHRKRIFSKTLSRVEIFENAVLLYSSGCMKTEVLDDDYVTVLDTSKCACSHQRWYRFLSLLRFREDVQKRLKKSNVWTRIFLKTEKRNIRFQTKTETCRQGLRAKIFICRLHPVNNKMVYIFGFLLLLTLLLLVSLKGD